MQDILIVRIIIIIIISAMVTYIIIYYGCIPITMSKGPLADVIY